MAENLGTATLELEGDLGPLRKTLGQAEREAGTSGEKASSSFGEKFSGGVKRAALPAAAALGLIAIGGKKATDAASDLNESVNAVNVVFGKAGKRIHDFSKVAGEEAGLSMRQLNELVTPVGAGLINAGFAADEAATASVNLAKRAADMASVFNVDVSEALGAIQAGLRGEADPLERFGVGLSEAAVTAHALELGLGKTAGELDANDKAQARLSLIMKQTDKVAGDFKNTSDELANSQRINAAEVENQQAKLGQGLLPVMETYQDLVRAVTTFLGEHTTATKIVVGVVAGLALGVLALNAAMKLARAATVAWTAVQWLLNAALTANPIGLVIVAIAALAAAVIIAWQRSDTFREKAEALWELLKKHPLAQLISRLDDIARLIKEKVTGALDDLGGKWDSMKKKLDPVVDLIKKFVGYIRDVIDLIKKIPDFPKLDIPFIGGPPRFAPNVGAGMGAAGGGSLGLHPNILDELALGQMMGLRLSSGKRGPRFPGDRSYHILGKAIDMVGSHFQMAQFALAAAGRQGIAEVFYDPLGGRFRIGGHSDHVHVATYDQGGFLPPGVTLAQNLTGMPERILSPREGEALDLLVRRIDDFLTGPARPLIGEYHAHGPGDEGALAGTLLRRLAFR